MRLAARVSDHVHDRPRFGVIATHDDRTCTTTPFTTPQFTPRQTNGPEMLQQGRSRGRIFNGCLGAIDEHLEPFLLLECFLCDHRFDVF